MMYTLNIDNANTVEERRIVMVYTWCYESSYSVWNEEEFVYEHGSFDSYEDALDAGIECREEDGCLDEEIFVYEVEL